MPRAEVGDSIYFRHPQRGACFGTVAASGADGCLVDDEDGNECCVHWDDVLGHRKHAERHMRVVDRGEDGSILEDERGKRIYVSGAPDDKVELDEGGEDLHKSQLLVDVGALSCGCTDYALETLSKALSEDEGRADIWAQHDSPAVRDLIEHVTRYGTENLSALHASLLHWLEEKAGKRTYKPLAFVPWAPGKAKKVMAYLASKDPALWDAADYLLMVDYLVYAHFPQTFPAEVTQLASQQAAIMGRTQAALGTLTMEQATAVLTRINSLTEMQDAMAAAQIDQAIIEYGEARTAQTVVAFTDAVRNRLKFVILDYEKSKRLVGKPQPEALETKLLDEFGDLNRDWRRIAVTETGEMANQGLISALKPGDKVKRLEHYQGACPFCKKIDGVVATVVAADKSNKDWATEVWPGKTNVGRSASPYKRVGGALVAREPDEMWTLPAGLVHPHCRGQWLKLGDAPQDDEFTRWLSETLKHAAERKRDKK